MRKFITVFCILHFAFLIALQAQTRIEIKMPATGYAAQFVGVSARVAGDTVSGSYSSGLNKHIFDFTKTGFYRCEVDAAGGTSWTAYTAWNGPDGYRWITTGDTLSDGWISYANMTTITKDSLEKYITNSNVYHTGNTFLFEDDFASKSLTGITLEAGTEYEWHYDNFWKDSVLYFVPGDNDYKLLEIDNAANLENFKLEFYVTGSGNGNWITGVDFKASAGSAHTQGISINGLVTTFRKYVGAAIMDTLAENLTQYNWYGFSLLFKKDYATVKMWDAETDTMMSDTTYYDPDHLENGSIYFRISQYTNVWLHGIKITEYPTMIYNNSYAPKIKADSIKAKYYSPEVGKNLTDINVNSTEINSDYNDNNLIKDGSFEWTCLAPSKVPNKRYEGWQFLVDSGSGEAEAKWVDTYAKHGRWSFRVDIVDPGGSYYKNNAMSVSPSTTYYLSCYHSGPNGIARKFKFRVKWYNSSRALISTWEGDSVSTSTTSPTWAKYDTSLASPANTSYAEIQLIFGEYVYGNYLYIDGVYFSDVASPIIDYNSNSLQITDNEMSLKANSLQANQLILRQDDISHSPLIVHGLSPGWDAYNAMAQFYQYGENDWKAQIDYEGNIWVNYARQFVTASPYGVSNMHLRSFYASETSNYMSWGELMVGTSLGFMFTHNCLNNDSTVIAYAYQGSMGDSPGSNTSGFFAGQVGLGGNQVNADSINVKSVQDRIMDDCPIYINTWGQMFQNDGQLQIPNGSEWPTGEETGQIFAKLGNPDYLGIYDGANWKAVELNLTNPGELPIISGLIAHLDANALTGLNDNDDLTTWTDESGSSNPATQSTTLDKPHYRTNIKNNLPAIEFDGTNHYMVFTGGGDWNGVGTDSLTIFAVSYSEGSGEQELTSNWTSNAFVMGINSADDIFCKVNTTPTGVSTLTHTGSYRSTWTISTLRIDTEIRLGLNGESDQETSIADTWSNNDGDVHLGKLSSADSYLWEGYIAEVVVYNRSLSNSEKTEVVNYLNTKWNVY